MIDEDGLNVWFEQRLVGHLWRNDIDYIAFQYASEWLAGDGFPISRRLALQSDVFAAVDGVAHRFFANLLPEGGAREHVVRDLKIANTDFDLLKRIGGECAGALSILPAEHEPSSDYRYQSLSEEELYKLVARRGHPRANISEHERPRLSLAGAQDKCALLYRDGKYASPVGDAPSTHILKFESNEYRHLPTYETFTSHLARAIGLPVVDIALQEVKGKKFAQIARYDRGIDVQSESDTIQRVHQEDFCQALGFAHTRKYQHDGGPTFAQCIQLLRDNSDDPSTDITNLLRWQIFNVLAGNSDGHAKNLSLLYHPNGHIRLAPFYDLVCTRAIDRIDTRLAFDVGGQRNPALITADDWHAFSKQCDLGAKYVLNQVKGLASDIKNSYASCQTEFELQYGSNAALQRIERIVNTQCSKVI